MNRREFIKGSASVVAIASTTPLFITIKASERVDYLGNWAGMIGIHQMPDESDGNFRGRLLSKLRNDN